MTSYSNNHVSFIHGMLLVSYWFSESFSLLTLSISLLNSIFIRTVFIFHKQGGPVKRYNV